MDGARPSRTTPLSAASAVAIVGWLAGENVPLGWRRIFRQVQLNLNQRRKRLTLQVQCTPVIYLWATDLSYTHIAGFAFD
jgi:hypothetical protein